MSGRLVGSHVGLLQRSCGDHQDAAGGGGEPQHNGTGDTLCEVVTQTGALVVVVVVVYLWPPSLRAVQRLPDHLGRGARTLWDRQAAAAPRSQSQLFRQGDTTKRHKRKHFVVIKGHTEKQQHTFRNKQGHNVTTNVLKSCFSALKFDTKVRCDVLFSRRTLSYYHTSAQWHLVLALAAILDTPEVNQLKTSI